jgi:hypothetical protein
VDIADDIAQIIDIEMKFRKDKLDESKIYAEILCDTKASQKLDVIIHGQ